MHGPWYWKSHSCRCRNLTFDPKSCKEKPESLALLQLRVYEWHVLATCFHCSRIHNEYSLKLCLTHTYIYNLIDDEIATMVTFNTRLLLSTSWVHSPLCTVVETSLSHLTHCPRAVIHDRENIRAFENRLKAVVWEIEILYCNWWALEVISVTWKWTMLKEYNIFHISFNTGCSLGYLTWQYSIFRSQR